MKSQGSHTYSRTTARFFALQSRPVAPGLEQEYVCQSRVLRKEQHWLAPLVHEWPPPGQPPYLALHLKPGVQWADVKLLPATP